MGQEVINGAKGQAEEIRAKVREEERQRLADSRAKADKLVRDAERDAAIQVQQGVDRRKQLEEEANRLISQARAQATDIVAQAKTRADQLELDAHDRVVNADRVEAHARTTVVQAYQTLAKAAKSLADDSDTLTQTVRPGAHSAPRTPTVPATPAVTPATTAVTPTTGQTPTTGVTVNTNPDPAATHPAPAPVQVLPSETVPQSASTPVEGTEDTGQQPAVVGETA
ncbi:hypothetical protein CSQ85_11990 [Bifidobacterium rousetti]|uniref:hypothetical protein n=1 Tax=Bifidobacterium rousetti TaxID=2045439 RepID=UPI00123BD143|nr:hypothetical protein [Bifidobacterium rousetti]KAA8816138.1 hypothetical protein CSQ85_11990 [Bifidobacterium rousetti]